MIRVCLVDLDSQEVKTGGQALLAQWNPEQHFLWCDLSGVNDIKAHATLLKETFNVPELAVNDVMRDRHPPKFESFVDLHCLMLRGLDQFSSDIDFGTLEIAFVWHDNLLITRHAQTSVSTDGIWEHFTGGQKVPHTNVEILIYEISRAITDRYLPIVLAMEDRIEDIEKLIFGNPSDDLLAELLLYSRQLKRLRRLANYHEKALQRLQANKVLKLEESQHYFHDLLEHSERLMSLSQLFGEMVSDLINGYISVSSHRLNRVMKVLTIVTVIFVPLTFVAGIYGMNFEYMPELKIHSGYFIVLGSMAGIAVAMLALFRKIKWL